MVCRGENFVLKNSSKIYESLHSLATQQRVSDRSWHALGRAVRWLMTTRRFIFTRRRFVATVSHFVATGCALAGGCERPSNGDGEGYQRKMAPTGCESQLEPLEEAVGRF